MFKPNLQFQQQFLLLLVVALLPSLASANAGTPLMWATMLHLVIGNAIIGVVEGFLLALFFRLQKVNSVLILIAANYISAWLGGLFFVKMLVSQVNPSIANIQIWFWRFVCLAFVITVLLEVPFFLLALRKTKNAMVKAIVAALLIHGISYSLLFGWYWKASGTSMITDLHIMPASRMALPDGYTLYYLSMDGHKVLRSNLDGGTVVPVKEVNTLNHRNDRLFARPNTKGSFDLFIFLGSDRQAQERDELVLQAFSSVAPVDWRLKDKASNNKTEGTWLNYGEAAKVATQSDWEYQTGFWPIEGIYGENSRNGAKFHFSLETPFVSWVARNAMHLADEFVVFQLGDDQICVLQPQLWQIALIARGKGPIVVKE